MMMGRISKKQVHRYRTLTNVAIKYGFGYLVDRFNLHPVRSVKDRVSGTHKAYPELSDPERLRLMLEELGPTYIKFGQILSTRYDILPKEYIKELEKLQDTVPPFSHDEACRIITEEFEMPVDEIFETFSCEPYASASLGQVHLATLPNGDRVIVKVQRPGIKDIIDSDLRILRDLAHFAEQHIKEARALHPVGVISEFERIIRAELDYTLEAQNADELRGNFSDDPAVKIPNVYWDYTRWQVLTMEFIDGIKVSDLEAIEQAGMDRTTISRNFATAFLKQIFQHGTFHGDPHPGNVLAMEGNVVAFVDFGIIGHLDQVIRADLVDFFIALSENDADSVIDVLAHIGIIDYNEIDLPQFRFEISNMITKYYGMSLRYVNTGVMMREMISMIMRHHGNVPSNLLLLSKALMIEEEVCSQLDPDYNLQDLAKPFIHNLVVERMHPKRIIREWLRMIPGFGRLMRGLPHRIDQILLRAEKGTLRLEFEHHGLDHIVSELDVMSNRIASSMIISAIIIASALVIQSGMRPFVCGVPVIGIIGFVIAGILGMWLVLSIMRSGRY
ncbi:MAG: 2-octaprenyl-3-methyl-6-methoxy-1,4-benzoquinol hydroxylase [Candidatus Methanogaster sp.]|uniref:2-octaprenyl-3-methyl-6-methoxy-1,4-benzoquinol hydroxylase n=1 Tax=Candidatus Methanogaster sp. TaxID=3386292 RepID=A0AC61KZL7_9EURY|nr:MAG: 2-octaprenyl-3-methyl-6-methoxy-1,4-benzoquinol hydroxylase [ANME-2 cluster archaeon]